MRATLAVAVVMASLVTSAQAALPTGNLLVNPGFEQGPGGAYSDVPAPAIAGWTTGAPTGARVLRFRDPADTIAFYKSDAAATAGAGCRGFAGPATARDSDDSNAGYTTYSAMQDVALPAGAAGTRLRMGALLGRYGTPMAETSDYSGVSLQFRAADGTVSGPTEALEVDNFSMTSASSVEFTRREGTVQVPAGATSARVFVTSFALFDTSGAHLGPANGLVDDVGLTFDAKLPADPPAGCQPAAPSTLDAADLTQTTARLGGSIDTKHETVRYVFRYGTNGATDLSTAEATVGAADSPAAVSQPITNLAPNATYSYLLATRTVLDGQPGPEVRGATKTFTTPPVATPTATPVASAAPTASATATATAIVPVVRHNDPKTAITIGRPKGGCVKPGVAFKVSATDAAGGRRPVTRLVVRAGRKKTTGKAGTLVASVKVKRFRHRAPSRKAKLRVTVTVHFAAVPGVPDSADSVTLKRKFRYC